MKTYQRVFFVTGMLLTVVMMSLSACGRPGSPVGPSNPTPTFTPSFTPTSTPLCDLTPTFSLTAPSGIYWLESGVGLTSANEVYLMMSVNNTAESTAVVTFKGSDGTSLTLPFYGVSPYSSGNYALYGIASTAYTYTSGVTYTLTTVTSAGSASAALVAPTGITSVAADGSSVSYNQANIDFFWIDAPNPTQPWYPALCNRPASPMAVPSSFYTAGGSGNYNAIGEFENYTTNITGGTGVYSLMTFQNLAFTK